MLVFVPEIGERMSRASLRALSRVETIVVDGEGLGLEAPIRPTLEILQEGLKESFGVVGQWPAGFFAEEAWGKAWQTAGARAAIDTLSGYDGLFLSASVEEDVMHQLLSLPAVEEGPCEFENAERIVRGLGWLGKTSGEATFLWLFGQTTFGPTWTAVGRFAQSHGLRVYRCRDEKLVQL